MDTDLNYAHANVIPELQNNITARYQGAKEDNILVTVGAIEANYLTIRTLLLLKMKSQSMVDDIFVLRIYLII